MLKQSLLLSFILLLALACKENDDQLQNNVNPNAQNKWELAEVLYDPGDGSGIFTPVDSEQSLEFFDDNTVWSNTNLCGLGLNNPLGNWTYNYTDDKIEIDNCTANDPSQLRAIDYEFIDDELILTFFCIEPCVHKYRRLK